MAAKVREIAWNYKKAFTVDEITAKLMKSSPISSTLTGQEEDRLYLNKQISTILGRMVKKGDISREKHGIYRPNGVAWETTISGSPVDKADYRKRNWLEFREANRMRPPGKPGEPLTISWPLALEQEILVFPKNLVVVGGVTNSGKTTLGMNFAYKNMYRHKITYINSEMSEEELASRLEDFKEALGVSCEAFYSQVYFAECECNALSKIDIERITALMDPDGINIIDYVKIHDDFYKIGQCLEKIHARLHRGIVVVFFQKDPYSPHLLGKSFSEHLARVVMMVDIDKKTGLHCLQFTKVKFPARKGDRPERREIWFSVKDGVSLERVKEPSKAKNQKEVKRAGNQDSQELDEPPQVQVGVCGDENPSDLMRLH